MLIDNDRAHMPRDAFNTTCDVFAGPNTLTPGALKGTFPCRLVYQDGILVTGADSVFIIAWLTLNGNIPRGFWQAPIASIDPGLADQIAVPSGNLPTFWNLFTEVVNWRGQPVYYRANLSLLPLPPTWPLPPNPIHYGLPIIQLTNSPPVSPIGPSIIIGSAGGLITPSPGPIIDMVFV